MSVTQLRDGLHVLDLEFQGMPGVIASYLLQDSGETALIEIGPTSTLETLLADLEAAGVDPGDVSKILVTHVHLDHAGASGTFLRRFPGATLYVHEVGAPHMVDPSKLVASASRIYGAMMETLWGQIDPVPAGRIVTLTDGDAITVGKTRLTALYTPGHASHHVVFHDPERGEVFTGDAAAVRLSGHDYVRPPAPPPDIDLEAWSDSIERVRRLEPQALYLTHFGWFTDVDAHLRQTKDRLYEWARVVERAAAAGKDREAIIEELREYGDREIAQDHADPSAIARYELAAAYYMTVDGLLRYLRKRAPVAG